MLEDLSQHCSTLATRLPENIKEACTYVHEQVRIAGEIARQAEAAALEAAKLAEAMALEAAKQAETLALVAARQAESSAAPLVGATCSSWCYQNPLLILAYIGLAIAVAMFGYSIVQKNKFDRVEAERKINALFRVDENDD